MVHALVRRHEVVAVVVAVRDALRCCSAAVVAVGSVAVVAAMVV